MRARRCVDGAAAVLATVLIAPVVAAPRQSAPPAGALGSFTEEQRAAINTGAAVVEVLRERDEDFAVAGVVSTSVASERLVAWSRHIEELQRGRYVPLIQRFSTPPTIDDLSALILGDKDLEDLRECRPGRCGLKLSASEILQMNNAIAGGRRRWREAALEAFRAITLARVRAFQASGFRGLAAYDDEEDPVDPSVEFDRMLGHRADNGLFTQRVGDYLRGLSRGPAEGEESIYFWSKDLLGDAKPVISVTHLSILHGVSGEPTVVAAVQVFATHYINASVSLTAIVGCRDDDRRYLVYLRRSRVDVFGGTFGGLVRHVVKKRVRAEGPPVLEAMRVKLEGGLPSPKATTYPR